MPEAPGSTKDAPPSLISANLQIVGNLRSQGEVQIDGTVDGDVAANALTIGERATINGEIVADDVVVKGRVNGRIRARKVQLAKSARMSWAIFGTNCWPSIPAPSSRVIASEPTNPPKCPKRESNPVAQPKGKWVPDRHRPRPPA